MINHAAARKPVGAIRGGRVACALLIGALLSVPNMARADEGGVSFWVPGFFGSLAAVPPTPGWSLATIYYHTSIDAGGNVQFPRGGAIVAGLRGDVDLGLVAPSYTFATPVLWGGLATLSTLVAYGHLEADVDVSITGPLGRTVSLSRSDDRTGFGDLPLFAKVNWNAGVHNYMLYTAVNIPNGTFERRLANLSIGHWASDSGVGYTYLDTKSGWEFSAVLGFTYNWENHDVDYQNGIDMHLDWAASKFLTKQLHVGVVGYAYQQITGDSGAGAVLGGFESRVFGVGPQIGYIFPLGGDYQGYLNLKGYWEFQADNRPEGWNAWFTFSISPAPPRHAMK
jgi:hypothetical protein